MQEAEHHGDRWFKEAAEQGELRGVVDALKRATRAMGTPLGETGAFPHGTITPDDEGEIRIAVTARGGKVIFAFGKAVEWIGLSPREARQLADTLNKYADEA